MTRPPIPGRRLWMGLAIWAASGGVPGLARPAAAQQGLTAAPVVARLYDLVLDASFDRARADLPQACGPAPPEACRVLEAAALWWRIELDPNSRALDADFLDRVNGAIAAADAWTDREPRRAEAWFYLGAAYGVRVQWRVLRGGKLSAARDGKRIKDSLERALALDPSMDDAYFGIGLYHYYADVAPAAARLIRWLLLLPGGDRVKGLDEMQRARDRGALLRGEADYQLHFVYLWYERQPDKALSLLAGLRARYPGNPVFARRVAEIQDDYQHDRPASLATYLELLDAARRDRVHAGRLTEVLARFGAAEQLDALFETDRAVEHLQAIVSLNPSAPYGSLARAHLRLGRAYDRLGRRDRAVASYGAALRTAPPDDPLETRDRARKGLRSRLDPRLGEAYRLSLEGWRAIERGALDPADAALRRSLELNPQDPVARFRRAMLLDARRQPAAALAELDQVIRARAAAPPTIVASAYLEAGRLLERAGDRRRAIEMYRSAMSVFGADGRTRDAASQALGRLRAQSSTLEPHLRTPHVQARAEPSEK